MKFKKHILKGSWGGARFAYIGAFLTALSSDFTLNESLGVAGQALVSGFLAGGICIYLYYSFDKYNVLKCILGGYLGVFVFSLVNSLIIENTIFSNTLLLVKENIIDSAVSSIFVSSGLILGLYYLPKICSLEKTSTNNKVKLP